MSPLLNKTCKAVLLSFAIINILLNRTGRLLLYLRNRQLIRFCLINKLCLFRLIPRRFLLKESHGEQSSVSRFLRLIDKPNSYLPPPCTMHLPQYKDRLFCLSHALISYLFILLFSQLLISHFLFNTYLYFLITAVTTPAILSSFLGLMGL